MIDDRSYRYSINIFKYTQIISYSWRNTDDEPPVLMGVKCVLRREKRRDTTQQSSFPFFICYVSD